MLYSGSNPFPSPYGSSLEYFQPHRVTFDPIRTIGITPTAPVRRVVNRTPTTPRQVSGAFGSPTSAQAIRATGDQSQGPNAAYAQNLATYAGGAFKRSGSPML